MENNIEHYCSVYQLYIITTHGSIFEVKSRLPRSIYGWVNINFVLSFLHVLESKFSPFSNLELYESLQAIFGPKV